ncbi:hypothetical protein [Aurantiacibacter luteus]|uniref:Uncharacterized protein n=1 Tax=Aurantiacibacter luteus TaxID=1581420 RepID=A0A0G9MP25_9SPHN|nr:hypothetical protein [Aurantiacibacter luteus]KLE32460.1 hypothetical protein AAW00_13630 [Aurantiacibacter luteus]
MQSLAIMALLKIELPEHTVLLCDGGFITWAGDTYTSSDPVFGTLGSVEGMEEGQGNEIPALDLTMLPPGTAGPAELSKPGYQRSRVRLWLAEYDVDAGQVVGTPDLMFDGQIDQTTLRVGQSRQLDMSVVSNAERLFELDIGNTLSPVFHKSVWPGEMGHDNATGLSVPVAWGVESPVRSTRSGGYSGGGGFGGSFGSIAREVALRVNAY